MTRPSDLQCRLSWTVGGTMAILLTGIALALRLTQIQESLWVDELHTAWVVSASPGQIAARAAAGNQPPLYFYLVALATRMCGLTEAALRLPSVTAGVMLVPLSFAVVRHWTASTAAGVAAALTAAVDRDFLFYATEARVYAILQLLALLRLALFVELLAEPTRWRRGAYIGLATLMFHLHYTTALLWAGEALCLAVAALRHREGAYRWSQFIADSAVSLLLLLPALPHVAEVLERRGNWARFVPLPTTGQLASARFARRVAPLACYLLPPLLCGLAAAVRRRIASHSTATSPRVSTGNLLLFVGVWVAAPVAIAWGLSVADVARVFLHRYLIASAAAVPLLVGLLCGRLPTSSWRLAAATATALAALGCATPQYISQWRQDQRLIGDREEDWRAAVAFINRQGDHSPLVLASGLIEAQAYAESSDPLLRAYCVLPVTSIYRVDPTQRQVFPLGDLSQDRLAREVCRQAAEDRGAWLLMRLPRSRKELAMQTSRRLFASCGYRPRVAEPVAFGNLIAVRVSLE